MFNKNVSPPSLSLLNALVITGVVAILALITKNSWLNVALITIITFLTSYFLFKKSVEIFIYRKFKLIYKFIYETKANKKEAFFYDNIVPQKTIQEVSDDVMKWGVAKRKEIEALKENEIFRKEFLMNLSHELKTPIFTAQGYIDTLLAGGINDTNINERFLKNASRSIHRLVQLTKDLDEISKLESKAISINYSNFKISQLIIEVIEELELKASEKNMQLKIKEGSETKAIVHADLEKIKQVLVNLIENAIKYGNENGNITCGIYELDDEQILVEVSDDGPGIPKEHLSRVFERFYRIDRARSRNVGGTGLGLAIVKHIIEAHHQTITVRSTENVGSSFGFTLAKAQQ